MVGLNFVVGEGKMELGELVATAVSVKIIDQSVLDPVEQDVPVFRSFFGRFGRNTGAAIERAAYAHFVMPTDESLIILF